jgi:hypothetical protein
MIVCNRNEHQEPRVNPFDPGFLLSPAGLALAGEIGLGPALKAKPPRKRSSKRTARASERWKAGRTTPSPKEQGAARK